MSEISVGDMVSYSRSSKWIVVELFGSLAMIEDFWDTRVVPIASLKKVVTT